MSSQSTRSSDPTVPKAHQYMHVGRLITFTVMSPSPMSVSSPHTPTPIRPDAAKEPSPPDPRYGACCKIGEMWGSGEIWADEDVSPNSDPRKKAFTAVCLDYEGDVIDDVLNEDSA